MLRIAIDGPAAAGKTTQAKALAKALGLVYCDTGALYRAVAVAVCETIGKGNVSDKKWVRAVTALLPSLDITVAPGDDGTQITYLNGVDIGPRLRTPEISMASSAVSAIPAVRAHLLKLQQDIAKAGNVVMEGRDIGTVVMPEAEVKVFLTAHPAVRAMRRYKELEAKGGAAVFDDIYNDVKVRDADDGGRKNSPMVAANDAVLLNNSNLNIEQTTAAILCVAVKKLGAAVATDVNAETDAKVEDVSATPVAMNLNKLLVSLSDGSKIELLVFYNKSADKHRFFYENGAKAPYDDFEADVLSRMS